MDTYHEWKKSCGSYCDHKGFCKSATVTNIEKHNPKTGSDARGHDAELRLNFRIVVMDK